MDFVLQGETHVATIVQPPGEEGAAYVIRFPDGSELRLGNAQEAYWQLANVLDGEEVTMREENG